MHYLQELVPYQVCERGPLHSQVDLLVLLHLQSPTASEPQNQDSPQDRHQTPPTEHQRPQEQNHIISENYGSSDPRNQNGPQSPSPKIDGYSIIRRDRTRNGGGLATIIEAIIATMLAMGDANAHNGRWLSPIQPDTRGSEISEVLSLSNLVVVNKNCPTRLPFSDTRPSSPDITAATDDIALLTNWHTINNKMSDHLLLLITVETNDVRVGVKHKHNCMWNIKKADWEKFEKELDDAVSAFPEPTNPEESEKLLREAATRAAEQNISRGCHHQNTPFLPAEIGKMTTPLLTTPQLHRRTLSKKKRILNRRKTKRMEFVEKNTRLSTGKIWQAVSKINDKKHPQRNTALIFDGKVVTKTKKIADKLNRFLANSCEVNSLPETRKSKRNAAKLKPTEEDFFTITTEDVLKAIGKMFNSKVAAPDGMASFQLKHFMWTTCSYVAKLIQLSLNTGRIPAIWKNAKVVPLQKPNKPAHEPDSYIPVSILPPLARLAEIIILPQLQAATDLPKQQHAFKKGHSTVTAVCSLTEKVIKGFNCKKPALRTAAVAIDLKRAFDTVNLDKLINMIINSRLNTTIKKWLACYLRGREQRTSYKGVLSKSTVLKTGVPQGSLLSPILFTWYLQDIPQPSAVETIIYTDDITIFCQNTKIYTAALMINSYLDTLARYLKSKQLYVSTTKCAAMPFSTWNAEWKTDLNINRGKGPKHQQSATSSYLASHWTSQYPSENTQKSLTT